MPPSLFDEFTESTQIARTDRALARQLLLHYKTCTLLPPTNGLIRSTCIALAWNVQQARIVFNEHPELIRAVISDAPCANALAVWGDEKRHWIVITEGLMVLLRDAAEVNAARILEAFPTVFASAVGRRVQAATPLQGFQTMLGALLYFGAISFVASHELGHHLAGHGAWFNSEGSKGSGGVKQNLRSRWDVPHALERQADAIGVGAAILSINKLMARFFAMTVLTPEQRKDQQALVAIVFTAGVFTIAARLIPDAIDAGQVPATGHPPNVYRMIKIAATLMRPLRSLALLDDPTRKWIRIKCLEIVLGPHLHLKGARHPAPDDPAAPAAARLHGIRQALYDPSFQAYMNQLDTGFRLFKENLSSSS